jgi:hypothetical protein
VNFEATVLQGDRTEILCTVGAHLFWEEDDVGLVDGAQVGGEVILDQIPIPFKESRSKAIGARAGIIVHGEEGCTNLREGERVNKGGFLRGGQGGSHHKAREASLLDSMEWSAEEIFKEAEQDGSLSRV